MFFRELYFEVKYLFEEIFLACKHPSRKATYEDIWSHWRKIWRILIFHPWYCLKRGIRNLCIWFPIIWSNDSWDYLFLIDMMDKQLSEMEKFWHSYSPVVMKKNHIAKRITWIRKLQKMWREDYYSTKAYEEHERMFGISKFESEVCKTDEYGIPVLYKMIDNKTEEQKKEYRNMMDVAYKKDEKVFKLWIKNFSKVRMFWD